MQAIWRLLTLIYISTIGSIIFAIIFFIAAIWAFFDFIIQIIFNSNVLSERSRPAFIVINTWNWWAGQWSFALTGGGQDGRFKILPNWRLDQVM